MKTLVTVLVFTLGFSSFSLAQENSITADHKLHFAAGAVISGGTYAIVYSTTKNKKKAFWYSLSASVLAGLAKEVYDSGKDNNEFDTSELVATSLGGLTASVTINIFTGKNRN